MAVLLKESETRVQQNVIKSKFEEVNQKDKSL